MAEIKKDWEEIGKLAEVPMTEERYAELMRWRKYALLRKAEISGKTVVPYVPSEHQTQTNPLREQARQKLDEYFRRKWEEHVESAINAALNSDSPETPEQPQAGERYCLKPRGRFVTVIHVTANGQALTFAFDDGKDSVVEWPMDEFLKWAVKYNDG